MKIIGIIPTRYDSKRLPGKPLAMLGSRPMIQWVYQNAIQALDRVVVATDDDRIEQAVKVFGGEVVLTGKHSSGTSRVCEACTLVAPDADVVVNIQGDEPFLRAADIRRLINVFDKEPSTEIATLVSHFDPAQGYEALSDPNTAKVVVDNKGYALYFSRSVIPHLRGVPTNEWLNRTTFLTHVGIYAYRLDTLRQLVRLPASRLQQAESLEQLVWLENGYRVLTTLIDNHPLGIDTPADLAKARQMISNH